MSETRKPRVYWEDAPEDHDPDESCWWVAFTYRIADGTGWGTIRQGFRRWLDAYQFAYLQAVTMRLEEA